MKLTKRNDFDVWEDAFFTNHENNIMRTDIKEKKDIYEISVDLPGYNKENIKMSLEDGYLTIEAILEKSMEEKEDGKFVCKERYSGSCSRSFYVGEDIQSEEIKAKFLNGILTIEIPKKVERKGFEKKYIAID